MEIFWLVWTILNKRLELLEKEFPLRSVIITARNEEKMIESCINSVFEQNYPNFEIIYVDAESTDQSYEIVLDLENKKNVFDLESLVFVN